MDPKIKCAGVLYAIEECKHGGNGNSKTCPACFGSGWALALKP